LWDKPFKLEEFFDHLWDKDEEKPSKSFIEFDIEDVE
jgi:hypothetical protein